MKFNLRSAAPGPFSGKGTGADTGISSGTSTGTSAVIGILILALMLLIPQVALGGNGVGVRYGWADVPDEVFDGSGDLGGTNLVGIHLRLAPIPLLNIEVAGEYVNNEFSFDQGLFDGIEAAGNGEYEDLTLLATMRMNIFTMIVLPLKIYVGGGLNVHFIDLQFDETPTELLEPVKGASSINGDLEDAVEDLAGDSSEAGWHLIGGAELSFPGSAISIFIEGRYMDALDTGVPKSNAVYGGFTIEL